MIKYLGCVFLVACSCVLFSVDLLMLLLQGNFFVFGMREVNCKIGIIILCFVCLAFVGSIESALGKLACSREVDLKAAKLEFEVAAMKRKVEKMRYNKARNLERRVAVEMRRSEYIIFMKNLNLT